MNARADPSQRERALGAAALVANVLWFAGLFRVLGEAVSPMWSTISLPPPSLGTFIAGVMFVVVVVVELAVVWHWRRPLREAWHDALTFSIGREVPARSVWHPRRLLVALAVALAPSVLIAILLPGMLAGAVCLVAGLVLRTTVATIAAAT